MTTERFRTAFVAYPAKPPELIWPIEAAKGLVDALGEKVSIQLWPHMDVFGAYIPDEVRAKIRESSVFVCDVTRPNLNVYYEAGYSIGERKAIAPIVNKSFAGAVADIQRDGFFDNIGFETYENSGQLRDLLINLPTSSLVDLYAKPTNFQQPLYLLDTFRKTEFRNAIVSAIKVSKVFYRSFDPVETSRFSTVSMIAEASASSGVIIPFLGSIVDDSERHNLRAAFLAGLSHGLGRQTLLLQLPTEIPIPADFRDLVTTVQNEKEIAEAIASFANLALIAAQEIRRSPRRSEKTALQRLSLGASAAENEFRTLEEYFVETSEFVRTRRGEVSIVAGRKGSGKTAIFFRVRDSFREERDCLVTDLKPESHQLSLFREELLKVVNIGLFDHTLAAFWYFVILSEVLLTLKRAREHEAKRDSAQLVVVKEIEDSLAKIGAEESGDFTSRLNRLGVTIVTELRRLEQKGEPLTPERLTNVVFGHGVAQIRALIHKHTQPSTRLIFLFDNIDKGWPASGISSFDIRLVRLLIEGLDKIRRDFNTQQRDFKSVVFLRNDIYELLVEATPDRGKAGEIRIDWTDRAKLRQVIYRRLQASTGDRSTTFEKLWERFFVLRVNERDSFEYFVDHCLMRPRFLINIVENALANAINRGHQKVNEDDCVDAVRQHSLYLMDDFGYEIRDVSGLSADILYTLIGVTKLLTREEVLERFRAGGVSEPELESAFRLMLWYGMLGIASPDGKERFIYDYDYNMRRLNAEIRNSGGEMLYVTNTAIHVALSS